MLTRVALRARVGVTLIELLVTTIVGGIVLGLVSAACVKQQRIVADLERSTKLAGQLREGASILPIDLRGVSSIAGDIREARDTSIELRATIASAVVCDTIANGLVLPAADGDASLYYGSGTPIATGDTVWLFTATDTGDGWIGRAIESVRTALPGACHAMAPPIHGASARTVLMLDSPPLPSVVGSPLRITRVLRYSLYRSSDGSWNLGQRDWNAALARFNTIQPVSGPYLSPAMGGMALHYYDSAGALLPVPVPDTRAIALIRFELRGQTKVASSSAPANRLDSVSTWIALPNRR